MCKKIVLEVVQGAKHYRATINPHDPVTVCEIHSQSEPIHPHCWFRVDYYGIGVRKHGDVYDRETGCRMALASALRKVPDLTLRAEFWKLYLEKFPVSKRTDPMAVKAERLLGLLKSICDFSSLPY